MTRGKESELAWDYPERGLDLQYQDAGRHGSAFEHGFNLKGPWLLHEEVMSKIYYKLAAKPKTLHVPDLASLCRKSNLSQKTSKGTLITEPGIEHVEYASGPCTNHPDYMFRLRAFLMTICRFVIDTPDWFTLESA